MKYIEYKEHRIHGTKDFPFAYYMVSENHPRYLMQYHWHNEYEIIHIFEGVFRLTVNNSELVLKSGDSAFIESGALHGGSPESCQYVCIVFDLDSMLSSQTWASDLNKMINSYDLHFNSFLPSSMVSVQECIVSLCNSLEAKNEGYRLTTVGALIQLLGLLVQNGAYTKNSELSPMQQKKISQLKAVISFISKHYSEDITLADMTACANMNKNYFCKFFHDAMHKTPIEYLNYYRVESACEQLLTTDKSILTIAMDCGFHDVSYFVKVFKKFKGMVPSSYKK